jgi:hypothetical protein
MRWAEATPLINTGRFSFLLFAAVSDESVIIHSVKSVLETRIL